MEENPKEKPDGFLKSLSKDGFGDQIIRIGTPILTIGVIGIVIIGLGSFYVNNAQLPSEADLQATAEAIIAPTLNAATGLSPDGAAIEDLALNNPIGFLGIPRLAEPKTIIPQRERVDIITYVVQVGDSVFSIAEQNDLRPETILWSNFDKLNDNPREIYVDMELNILPIDGLYYRYNIGESLNDIAKTYKAEVQNIIEWPGNNLDPYEIDPDNPGLADGTMLIIPGGFRELPDWGPPAISRDNPAVAAYYGEGACGAIYEGPIGGGTFVWPTPATYISGFDYDPNIHPGIDIAGAEGNAVFAVDAGVVVFAGWTNTGYGYLIVIDHGNGWQSAYAHLSGVGVICGQGVFQGSKIGGVGNTGNSSGSHLHFELQSTIYGKVNPWNYLIIP